MTDFEHEYGADEITVLEGLEAVRKRPGMYIGATSQRGLHHLVYEVLDNSVDEALAGHCDQITTTLLPDGSISVRDNGRGIPVGPEREVRHERRQVVLTMLHAGGKFGGGGYKVSGGLHGVGVSVVNALSEWLTVEVRARRLRRGRRASRAASRRRELVQGEPTTETGTTVTFKPDADIFETTDVDFEVLETREREMAFLTRGLRLTLIDQRTEDRVVEFYAENGLADYVRHINKNRTPTHKTQIAFERETEDGVGRGRDAVERQLPGLGALVREQHQHARGRHAPDGLPLRADAHGQRLCALDGADQGEGRAARAGRRARGPRRDHLGEAPGPAVRGPDEDEARQLADAQPRRDDDERRARRVVRGAPGRGARDHQQGAAGRARPPGRAQGARPRAPQDRARELAPAGQAQGLLEQRPGAVRALPGRGQQRRRHRRRRPRPRVPGDPAAARQDPQRREGADQQDPLERRDPGHDHRRSTPASARSSTSRACATTRSWR